MSGGFLIELIGDVLIRVQEAGARERKLMVKRMNNIYNKIVRGDWNCGAPCERARVALKYIFKIYNVDEIFI